MKVAKPLQNVINSFQRLPGIGPKSAQRLAFYLLHVPQHELDEFATSLTQLKKDTKLCSICRNVAETDPCPICADNSRDMSTILVVEQPLDLIAFEKTSKFRGLYHVLHGAINPLENIGPDELYLEDLVVRIKNAHGNPLEEIIIATNPTMEGEATAMYLKKRIDELGLESKVTRLGMGIPTGAYLEFADEITLSQAIEGRRGL
ncbi:recombination protein RecR [Candidatus Woesebacteria bacterium RIFCSPHIGHO2_01_FULL_41_10]|uniref:Recombination protein RecR n=1 Tax=Candidatus Woesebacteria bacterium RIFCSPHIGHO2_01_FULL_41_10 TaxID=1802500 RepID=A0A1F7YRP5_9BACT|nr:MAG: recombination protein RecR [Candidatus Woesebacteria bacterium RIFCSPHIGHO2_01_FULL_41_10]